MKIVSKVLQAIGIAEVMTGLVVGVTQNDMWKELYLTLTGIGFFSVGWLISRWSHKPRAMRGKHRRHPASQGNRSIMHSKRSRVQ